MRRMWLFLLLVCLPASSQAQTLISTSTQVYKGGYRMSSVSGLDFANCIAFSPSRQTWFGILNRNNHYDILEFYMPDMSNYPGTTYGTPPKTYPAGVNLPSTDPNSMPPVITKTEWGTFISNQQDAKVITAISTGNPTTVTTSTNHTFKVGDQVWFNNTDSTPPFTPGTKYTIASVPTPTTFTVAVNITGAGTTGTVSKTSPYPVGNGPVDTSQYESYGCYWDDNAGTNGRLIVNYGNYYACSQPSDDFVMLGVDFTNANPLDVNNQPTIYGPWIMSYLDNTGTRQAYNCGEAQTQSQPAPNFIIGDTTQAVLDARGCPGSGSGSTRKDNCNGTNGPTADFSGKFTNGIKNFLVTGEKQSGTGGRASWGTLLEICDYPLMLSKTPGNYTPASDGGNSNSWIDCHQLIYWLPAFQDLTDDIGTVHTGVQQAGSPMKRRDPYGLILGNNSVGSITGRPLDCAHPYGLYNTPILNQVGYTGYNGWAPGIGNNGDTAYHFYWVDEDSTVGLHGLAFLGTYGIGYHWYGTGTAFSDDFDAAVTNTCPQDNTVGTLTQTTQSGWKGDDGIYADGTSPGFRGQITNISLTSGLTTCGGVSLTSAGNICLTSSCTCVTSMGNGLHNGVTVNFTGTNSTPALTTGTVANRSGDAFTVVANVTVAGNTGTITTIQGTYPSSWTTVSAVSLSNVSTCGGISVTPGVSCITASGHPFNNGDQVWFDNTNSTPNLNYGVYTVANKSANAFTIAATITNAGTTGLVSKFTVGTNTARWFQSWAFPTTANPNGLDTCGVNGTGTRNTTGLTTGYNPCRYVYARRNGGKGYNSEWTVPAWWVYQPSDILNSLKGTYNNTRLALNATVAVDHTSFDVFAAPPVLSQNNGGCTTDGVQTCQMSPKYSSFSYNDKTDNYNEKTNRSFNFNSAYFRPTGTASGIARRTYALGDSNIGTNAPQLVSVWDLNGTGCTDTVPTGPTISPSTTNGGNTTVATNSIGLVWSRESSANEQSYNVYRCFGTCGPLSNYTQVALGIPSGTLSQTASGLTGNTTYTFVVSAVNCAGETGSTPVTFVTLPDTTPLVPLSSRSLVFGLLYGFGSGR